MSTYRRATLAVISATTLVVLAPAAALGNSLLSGYGGPGQGSQAILGSGLINGGGGGGSGSSGGSGSGSGSGAAASGASSSTAGSSAQSAQSTVTTPRRRAPSTPSRRASAPSAVSGSSSAGASTIYSASSGGGSQAVAGASDPLGISGADLAYVLVAAGALALLGLVTRQFTQTPEKSSTPQARFDRTPRH
jgi:hypothetical protein